MEELFGLKKSKRLSLFWGKDIHKYLQIWADSFWKSDQLGSWHQGGKDQRVEITRRTFKMKQIFLNIMWRWKRNSSTGWEVKQPLRVIYQLWVHYSLPPLYFPLLPYIGAITLLSIQQTFTGLFNMVATSHKWPFNFRKLKQNKKFESQMH